MSKIRMNQIEGMEENIKAPKYDPSKKYSWDPNDEFVFTGLEFNALYNSMLQFINGDINVPNILKVVDTFAILQNKLMLSVESGLVKPLEEQAISPAQRVDDSV